jgi:hypothetical protein
MRIAGRAAVAVGGLLALSGCGSESHRLDYTFNLAAVTDPSPSQGRVVFAGIGNGRPFGPGNGTFEVSRKPRKGKVRKPPPGPLPPSSTRLVLRFGTGTLRIVTRGWPVLRGDGSLLLQGRGRVVAGTGEFEGAKGAFRVRGIRPQLTVPIETIRFIGSIEY